MVFNFKDDCYRTNIYLNLNMAENNLIILVHFKLRFYLINQNIISFFK